MLITPAADLGEVTADRLPDGEALLLRGNGAITLGAGPRPAVARLWHHLRRRALAQQHGYDDAGGTG
jgi:hypothetical protein